MLIFQHDFAFTAPPSSSICLGNISLPQSGVYTLVRNNIPIVCKAAELSGTAQASIVMLVHLVNDTSSTFYSMPLSPGQRTSAIFDSINVTGSGTLTYVTIFPVDQL